MEQEEVFSKVATLIAEAEKLLRSRIDELKPESSDVWSPGIHERDTLAVFLIRSLDRCTRTLRYLCDCTTSADAEVHFFALSQVRTLIDIYAKFLYLATSPDDTTRAKICIAYQTKTVSKIAEGQLQEVLKLNEAYTRMIGFEIPSEGSEIWKWYKKSGLEFPSINKILVPETMNRYAVETVSVFKAKDWYNIFSHISEIAHGNPYYHDKPHSESFWVATMTLSTTAYIIELVDKCFLNKIKPCDYREWLKSSKELQPKLIESWRKKLKN